MQRFTRLTCGAALIATCALVCGCVAVGGTRSSTAVQPTTGQQLIDLKRALDCGAVTQAEYDSKKTQLLSCK